MTILDFVVEGDRTVTRWSAAGTHRGELMGIPPTGRAVTITGIIATRFEGGRAVEEWEEMDLLGLMRQLGAMP
jgi:predicted ester cyclase